ncbi:MAG: M24 family metallopeptidase [Candidatus Zixiibacteriota bacterium]
MNICDIQQFLHDHDLGGWLLADFHGRNQIALQMLGLSGLVTRRSFYLIPCDGEPVGLVHAIEKAKFAHLPGKLISYSGYRQLETELRQIIGGCERLAMEYSANGRLPYIGLVDAGTIELIRDQDIDVVSSADLVATFQAVLSTEQIATHRMAAHNVHEIKERAFEFIAEEVRGGNAVTEHQVVSFILDQFERYDMETEFAPICAVDKNAGDPHYEPAQDSSTLITRGQLILIDLWAKIKKPGAVYADITGMAFAGSADEIPDEYKRIFAIISSARDRAVEFVRSHVDNRPVYGCEVDDVCRGVIAEAGYGDAFVHRTGHSITSSEHGPGPNIDNLETEDGRKLRQGHLFSIEPGIYLEQFGMRTEINVLIGHNGAEVTTLPVQTAIRPLF